MGWLMRMFGIGSEARRDYRLDQLEKDADESQAEITELIERMNGEDTVRRTRAVEDYERADEARSGRKP